MRLYKLLILVGVLYLPTFTFAHLADKSNLSELESAHSIDHKARLKLILELKEKLEAKKSQELAKSLDTISTEAALAPTKQESKINNELENVIANLRPTNTIVKTDVVVFSNENFEISPNSIYDVSYTLIKGAGRKHVKKILNGKALQKLLKRSKKAIPDALGFQTTEISVSERDN